MLSHPKKPFPAILFLLLLASLACQLPEATTAPANLPTNLPATPAVLPSEPPNVTLPPAVITGTPTTKPTAPPPVAGHRIAIRRIYGLAEFYDIATSERFIPRGVNYFVLVPVLDHYEDRLFAASVYDHKRTQADFTALSTAGYNTVRIILDGCTSGETCIGVLDGQGLNPAYLDNIVDLLNLAKASHLFVLFASQGLPELGGYAALADQGADSSFASGRNATLLTSAGIHASQKYWSDLLMGLATRQAPFDIILGWELLGEQYYQLDQPPFSLKSGKITAANGKGYDMYRETQKQALAVEGLRIYINELKQTILIYDPTTLVTMGFLAPDSPNPWREGDNRYVVTAPLLENSSLDFFDLHANPGAGLTMAQIAQNLGLSGHSDKPALMGQVGASTWSYSQVSQAAIAVQDWIASSCSLGFTGWLYSAYYPFPAGLHEAAWGFVDEHGTLLNALAPKNQPNACTVTVLPGRNLALNKTVHVSAALPDQPPEMAVDGNPSTQWSSGEFPTQWIEIDLGSAYSIGEIRLTVGQWPDGNVLHELWVGASPDSMHQVREFSGHMYDFDVLSYSPPAPLRNIRYVRVVTTTSPSWVSWREIEVLAPFPATPTPIQELTPTIEVTPTP